MQRPSLPSLVLAAVPALCALTFAGSSQAELWCAEPLVVHEWGVQVFAGGAARRLGPDAAALPRYFHDHPSGPVAAGPPVRSLPVDSGLRALPVVQFYAAGTFTPVPVGIEVGFRQGDATVWYPQIDQRRSATDANGAAAQAARAQLLRARAARANDPARYTGALPASPADPTRQLTWDALRLTRAPAHARAQSQVPWVDRLRGFGDALWVNGASESERFVFYEARTSERQALSIERGPTYAAGRRHVILRNASASPVFDVFLVHREGADTYLFYAPSIPAHATAGLVLEQHRTTAATFAAGSRARLRQQLTDAHEPRAPREHHWDTDDCVMGRDPAMPVEAAEGHRLYAQEVDALLEVWGARLFDAPGTTLVYREDTHYLDDVMPLSIYTDMSHFVRLRRAGLAVVENARLP